MDLQASIAHFKAVQAYDELPIPAAPSPDDVQRADDYSARLCGRRLPRLARELWKSLPTIGADGTEIYPPTEIADDHGWTAGLVDANESYPPPEGMVHVGRRDEDQISWRARDGHVFLTDVATNSPMDAAASLEDYFEETIGAALARAVIVLAKYPREK